jgi:muramoyltetrapeptide carboxypeptidase
MLKPRALRSGDRLAIVAPASGFDRAEFLRGVEEITRLGFEPVYDESVFERLVYVAGAAERRAAALRRAWRDPSIAGVLCARGGYGSGQLLPLLDVEEARQSRKPFVGYSDLTAVLNFLTRSCGMVAFHGPTVSDRLSRGAAAYDETSLMAALCRPLPLGEIAPGGLQAIHHGEASGTLLGGNVTQLLASLGTPFAFSPPQGFVFFFEEVGERPYRLDRMVTQLRQGGVLARASAVVIGELPKCDEPSGEVTGRAVMAELFADFPGPVVIGFPCGHTFGPALTIPLGVSCRVVADGRPRVVFEEAAVE